MYHPSSTNSTDRINAVAHSAGEFLYPLMKLAIIS